MTPTTSPIIEIPYREDTAHYVERLLQLPECIFFDSGFPQAERGRYDIFTSSPLYSLRYTEGRLDQSNMEPQSLSGNELIAKLNELLKKHQSANEMSIDALASDARPTLPFTGGFAGYFSYDLARSWESLPNLASRDIDIPELVLGFYPWAGVVDHQLKRAWLNFLPECPCDLKSLIQELITSNKSESILKKFKLINKLESQINIDSYKKNALKIHEYILNGDCYQVNYAQRFSAEFQGHPWNAYQKLKLSMAAPYGVYFQFKSMNLTEDSAILCYSPERFTEVIDTHILTQPIKGTIKRHQDPTEDKLNINQLIASEKNRAENLMIVDLLRNDLGKCCHYGTVKTEKLFELQSVSNVHHLVSSVTGHLADQITVFDLLQAILPGGSITGAPKLRSMEIIEESEPSRRSIYCGVMAYININGNMDSNVAIRTVLCTPQKTENGKLYCWGGGGIVADSEWQQEYQESLTKIDRILRGLEAMS